MGVVMIALLRLAGINISLFNHFQNELQGEA